MSDATLFLFVWGIIKSHVNLAMRLATHPIVQPVIVWQFSSNGSSPHNQYFLRSCQFSCSSCPHFRLLNLPCDVLSFAKYFCSPWMASLCLQQPRYLRSGRGSADHLVCTRVSHFAKCCVDISGHLYPVRYFISFLSSHEFSEFSRCKFVVHWAFVVFEVLKKSKSENHIEWEPNISEMIRGFQMWPQNSNRITFNPFWPKTVKNWDFWKYP